MRSPKGRKPKGSPSPKTARALYSEGFQTYKAAQRPFTARALWAYIAFRPFGGPLCYICPKGVPKDSEGPLAPLGPSGVRYCARFALPKGHETNIMCPEGRAIYCGVAPTFGQYIAQRGERLLLLAKALLPRRGNREHCPLVARER